MKADIYFTMTVDTEADDAWRNQDRVEMRNMACIPRFQALCEEYAVVPTYLLTYECAVREEALRVLRPIAEQGRCEIGYHFHSWTTPPFERPSPEGVDLQWRNAYQYEVPDRLFREKAQCLLKAIESAYGVRPTAHRAGRWGIDQRTVDWLVEHGFLVDTSVVPLWNLSASRGKSMAGPSFSACSRDPFFWPHTSSDASNPPCLMEVPLTVYAPTQPLPALVAAYIRRKYIGGHKAWRLYQKLIGGSGALRPNPAYAEGFVQKIIRSNLHRRPSILNMMIHSSELMVGGSPFSRTEADCLVLWNRLRQAFEMVHRSDIRCLGISAAAQGIAEEVNVHESTYLAPGSARLRRSGGLLQEAPRPIFNAGGAAYHRNPAWGERIIANSRPPAA